MIYIYNSKLIADKIKIKILYLVFFLVPILFIFFFDIES